MVYRRRGAGMWPARVHGYLPPTNFIYYEGRKRPNKNFWSTDESFCKGGLEIRKRKETVTSSVIWFPVFYGHPGQQIRYQLHGGRGKQPPASDCKGCAAWRNWFISFFFVQQKSTSEMETYNWYTICVNPSC